MEEAVDLSIDEWSICVNRLLVLSCSGLDTPEALWFSIGRRT